jgi:alpha-maltose-1-phosphate synthase
VKLVYVASDQVVPGNTGGSVHVLEVARGLVERGHAVHAVIHERQGQKVFEEEWGIAWHRIRWMPDYRSFRFRALPQVAAILREVRPEALLERYYNFGGEGIRAASALGLPSLLEVNSPVIDHPGSFKRLLDRLLVARPLERYRNALCRAATAIVSPLPEIVPEFARAKTEAVTWGANVSAFTPRGDRAELRRRLDLPGDVVIIVFCGSFRPWHGVDVLEEAARLLAQRKDLFFLLIGGGASRPPQAYRGRRLGEVPYDQMPEWLGAADIGVAPYDTRRLAQLRLGFYWSPLKIFEYMASGLPTITIPRPPLTEIVRDGEEGLHFREADASELARAIERLANSAALRRRLGENARRRVTAEYSWARHCEQLERILERITA